MEIQLLKGLVALIDPEDIDLVSGHRWFANKNKKGALYVRANTREHGKIKIVLMHRLIMSPGSGLVIDHIDGNGLNNQRSNLRVCTHSENMRNSKGRSHSQTGVRNVRLNKKSGKYEVCVRVESIRHRKSGFASLEDASQYAISLRAKLHGEFCYVQSQDSREKLSPTLTQ